MPHFLNKIAVIGNAAGGKTLLSRRLAEVYGLPVLHIDSVQFLPEMKLRPLEETRLKISRMAATDQWIIDGYGPLDILEDRFSKSDQIIFVDFPIRWHYFWATKRVIQNLWSRRAELPEGCSELSVEHIFKLYRTIHRIHHKMRPEILKMLAKPNYQPKTIHIQNRRDWNHWYSSSRPLTREKSHF